MRIIETESIDMQDVNVDGARGTRMRELITASEGAPTFAMRQFEIAPGGRTPPHSHPWEHEVYIEQGAGCVESESGSRPFKAGDAVFVAPDEMHSFVNAGNSDVRFLCLIPVSQACCR